LSEDEDVKFCLGAVYAAEWSNEVSELLFSPAPQNGALSLADGFELLDVGADLPPKQFIPLCVVDKASIAVVVSEGPDVGAVRRWFLDPVAPEHQGALLDVHPLLYVSSLEHELSARSTGLSRILDEIGPAYADSHLKHEKRPRTFVVRPIRLACQNVIVGLAAIAQEASIDGLAVLAWQTCEVPHVATHEANRALAVITLCDAFQNGGTMEIRFDHAATLAVDGKKVRYAGHPEGAVPASLRRFARTVGIQLGAEDPAAISPREARQLFRATTPMPDELRGRVDTAIATAGIKPERIYYTLLKPIWRAIELDWLLAVSSRAVSILEGGADWAERSARQAEAEACRTAVMAGMFYRRANATDAAAANGGARVVEDRNQGVEWSIDPESATIAFTGLDDTGPLPWALETAVPKSPRIVVAFRSFVDSGTVEALRDAAGEDSAILAVPRGTTLPDGPLYDTIAAYCPDRLADLDKAVEANLTSARISRA
jgi:hypothetical protein